MSLKNIQKWVRGTMVAGLALAGTMFQTNGCTIQINGLEKLVNGTGLQVDFGGGETLVDDGAWDGDPLWDPMLPYNGGGNAASARPGNGFAFAGAYTEW